MIQLFCISKWGVNMDFNGTVYAKKKHGSTSCYLIAPNGVANRFDNITVKPYKGHKYNSTFVWMCVG